MCGTREANLYDPASTGLTKVGGEVKGSIEIVFLRLQGNLLGMVTCGELVTWNWDQQFLASALGLVLKLIRTALFERNREAMGSEVNGGGGKDLPL